MIRYVLFALLFAFLLALIFVFLVPYIKHLLRRSEKFVDDKDRELDEKLVDDEIEEEVKRYF